MRSGGDPLLNGSAVSLLSARCCSRRREHATRGVTLHQADCLIGAVTAGIGARLATGNAMDFPMGEVTVEEWPPGS